MQDLQHFKMAGDMIEGKHSRSHHHKKNSICLVPIQNLPVQLSKLNYSSQQNFPPFKPELPLH